MSPGSLVDRADEDRIVEAVLRQAVRGRGSVLVVDGTLGSGRTAMLEAVTARAAEAGAGVLRARGGGPAGGFAFDVARQLFETWLTAMPERRRHALAQGPGRLAARLFSAPPGVVDPPETYRALHSMYWLCAEHARSVPLAVVVDDAHLADPPSAGFLSYLANRIADQPVLLAVALSSTGGIEGSASPLDGLAAGPAATVLHMRPLTRDGVAELARSFFGTEPEPGFVLACHRLTDGNLMLLRELLAQAEAHGLGPLDQSVDRLSKLTPLRGAHAVLHELSRLPEPAQRLARAMAVLGDESSPRFAAETAGLSSREAAQAAGVLEAAGLLRPGVVVNPTTPLLRSLSLLSGPDRRFLHDRAARLLQAQDAPATRIAEHLLRSHPAGDPQTVAVLREAGQAALAEGRLSQAAACLERALAEGVEGARRAEVLGDLGEVRLRLNSRTALSHLSQAIELDADPLVRARIARNLAFALANEGRYQEGITLLFQVRAELPAAAEDAVRQVDRLLVSLARISPRHSKVAEVGTFGGEGQGWEPATPADAELLAEASLDALRSGATAQQAAAMALAALASGHLAVGESSGIQAFFTAVVTLVISGRLGEADEAVRTATARLHGSEMVFARSALASLEALIAYTLGQLRRVLSTTSTLIRLSHEGWGSIALPVGVSAVVQALIDRDETDRAQAELERLGWGEELPDSALFDPVLEGRGRLRIAQGRTEEGLTDLLEFSRRCASTEHPTLMSYRSEAALAARKLGRMTQAGELIEEELERCRAFGSARSLGIALRASAVIRGGPSGIEQAEEALGLLEHTPARLEEARARTELAVLLRDAGHRQAAASQLREAMAIASRCGATALRRHAREQLLATGVRATGQPRPGRGVGALTARERSTVALAADGLTNRQIADTLVVTVKTVEWHLRQAYRKLGVRTRTQLRAVLVQQEQVGPGRPAPVRRAGQPVDHVM